MILYIINHLDLNLLVLFNQTMRGPLQDFLAPFFSSRAALFALMAACLIWTVRRIGSQQIALFFLLLAAMGLSDLSCGQIKNLISRVRPMNAMHGVYYQENCEWQRRPPDFVQKKNNGSSYPSAHAANSMTLTILTMLLWPRTRPWLALLPLLVGWSRIYLGKHYPTDVLSGWFLGLYVATFVWLIWKCFLEKYILQPPNN